MPSRAQVFTCYCESCKETGPPGRDGEPLGVVFPISQRISHLARVKAERNARRESLPTRPVASSITADITTAALVDSMIDEIPSSKSQLSRLWSSRDDYQDKTYVSEISNTISGDILDAMAESFGRLAVEPSINDLIASPTWIDFALSSALGLTLRRPFAPELTLRRSSVLGLTSRRPFVSNSNAFAPSGCSHLVTSSWI